MADIIQKLEAMPDAVRSSSAYAGAYAAARRAQQLLDRRDKAMRDAYAEYSQVFERELGNSEPHQAHAYALELASHSNSKAKHLGSRFRRAKDVAMLLYRELCARTG